MKKIVLVTAAAIAAMSNLYAADGTVYINGLVTDKTCDIVTPSGKDITVTLPTVSVSTLSSAGKVAGRTPFQINLANCSAGKVATYFEPGSTTDLASGHLLNTNSTGAKMVQVQLLGNNGLPLLVKAIGANGAQTNSQWVDVVAGGSANLDYFAEYFATGAATAGLVNSSVQYTIIYQ